MTRETLRQYTRRAGQTALTITLGGMLVFSQSGQAAVHFSDVPASSWAGQFIDYLTGRSIITGYPDQSFRPNQPVTRAEFAVMLAKSQGISAASTGSTSFVDVPATHWAAQAIQAVAKQGWIAGYPGGQFLPNQNISMAEMYTILAKATNQPAVSTTEADTLLSNFHDVNQVPAWARVSVATALKNGITVSELSKQDLFPNIQASRASVATSIAKLVNPSFRETTTVSTQPPTPTPTPTPQDQGQLLTIAGTLQATANPGEWVVVKPDGSRYFFSNPPAGVTTQSWFRVGNPVVLTGRLNMANNNTLHPIVNVSTLTADPLLQTQVSLNGTIRPSTATPGAWLIQTADNKLYRILNPDALGSTQLLRYGANVAATGNLRPDVNLPASEGTALVLSKLEAAHTTTSNEVSVTGTLKPTVEAGGWTLKVPNGNQTYVLLGTQPSEGQTWFKEGMEVMVTGAVRSDIPTIYQEGPVLVINSIQPSPMANTGVQPVQLFFPNLVNIVKDPATMLGNPLTRTLQGANIPQQAVQELLKGPSDVERLQGFFVDDDVKKLNLNAFNVAPNGTASVVLEAPADFQFKNNITPQRLDEQINRTLQQFSGIRDVTLSVKGPNNQVIWTSP